MSHMVKVFTDGDVEVYDTQGNLRMSLRQQVLTITDTGVSLRECGAEAKISPEAIESTKFDKIFCPLTFRGPGMEEGETITASPSDTTISGIYEAGKYGVRLPFTCLCVGRETKECSHTRCK